MNDERPPKKQKKNHAKSDDKIKIVAAPVVAPVHPLSQYESYVQAIDFS
jgi:hypothetical protein